MDQAQFNIKYRTAYQNMMKYEVDQAGCNIWCDKMVDLADDYPDLLEVFEAEEEQV